MSGKLIPWLAFVPRQNETLQQSYAWMAHLVPNHKKIGFLRKKGQSSGDNKPTNDTF